MKLENDVLCVEISELGAELTRVYDKENDTEILWNADPKYWKRHSPILFPNVGKTWENQIHIEGKVYPASAHGFARDTMFTCVEKGANRVTFMMKSTEETKKVYPYEFELFVAYQLSGKEIQVEWKVQNCMDKTMYFTIGGHPAFQFAEAGQGKDQYCLKFPGKESLTCTGLDLATGTGLPKESYAFELKDGFHELNEEMFSVDTFIFDEGQVEEVWLCKKDGTPYVGVRCPGFLNFGIWSPAGAPFICLEPWAGRCDDQGFSEDLSEKPGINMVAGGETFEKTYQIMIA